MTELVTGLDLDPRAAADRRRRAARRCDRTTSSSAGTRSSAESTRRTSPKGSCRRPAGSPRIASRPGPACGSTPGIEAGDEVSDLYDPMIAKLIVHDVDRDRAIARMLRALEEFRIEGRPTLLGFHRALLEHPCFARGETCEGVVESKELAERAQELEESFSHRTTSVAASLGRIGRRPSRGSSESRSTGAPTTSGSRSPSHPGPSSPAVGVSAAHRGAAGRGRGGRQPDAGHRAQGRGRRRRRGRGRASCCASSRR